MLLWHIGFGYNVVLLVGLSLRGLLAFVVVGLVFVILFGLVWDAAPMGWIYRFSIWSLWVGVVAIAFGISVVVGWDCDWFCRFGVVAFYVGLG